MGDGGAEGDGGNYGKNLYILDTVYWKKKEEKLRGKIKNPKLLFMFMFMFI